MSDIKKDYAIFLDEIDRELIDKQVTDVVNSTLEDIEAERKKHRDRCFQYNPTRVEAKRIDYKEDCDIDRAKFNLHVNESVIAAMRCGEYDVYYDELVKRDEEYCLFDSSCERMVPRLSASNFDYKDYDRQYELWEEQGCPATPIPDKKQPPVTLLSDIKSNSKAATSPADFSTSVYNIIHRNTPVKTVMASDGITRIPIPIHHTPYKTKIAANIEPKCMANGLTFEDIVNRDDNIPIHTMFTDYINQKTLPRTRIETESVLGQKLKYYTSK